MYDGRPQDRAKPDRKPEGLREGERQSQEGRKNEVVLHLLNYHEDMLAHASTNYDHPTNALVKVFDGANWIDVANANVNYTAMVRVTRNTRQFIVTKTTKYNETNIYRFRGGALTRIGASIKGDHSWIYQTKNGFYQMDTRGDLKYIRTKSIHTDEWKHIPVPSLICSMSHSYDEDCIYVITKQGAMIPRKIDPYVRIMGYADFGNRWGTVNIVNDGIMHAHNAILNTVVRFDPRASLEGTTVFSGDIRGDNRMAMFLNGHTFIKLWIDGSIDLVDLRNTAVYGLPGVGSNLTFNSEEIGFY